MRGNEGSLNSRASRSRWLVVSACSWPSASNLAIDGQSASSLPAGKSAEIEGLSTTGVSRPVSWLLSARAIASQSAAASFSAVWLDAAIAGTAAGISMASSGRASQVSLQREQRTVRPAAPKVAGLMA